jgi:hypothetical protein
VQTANSSPSAAALVEAVEQGIDAACFRPASDLPPALVEELGRILGAALVLQYQRDAASMSESPVGRVLRALNVDELPQLLNVLTGEMSLVGPRPSPFLENQVCVPWREARLSVRPGITGLWQVCRHNRDDGDFHQWIEYDLLYVQHTSFWLDLKILAATLATLGGKAGHIPAWRLVSSASTEHERRAARPEVVHSPTRAKQVA